MRISYGILLKALIYIIWISTSTRIIGRGYREKTCFLLLTIIIVKLWTTLVIFYELMKQLLNSGTYYRKNSRYCLRENPLLMKTSPKLKKKSFLLRTIASQSSCRVRGWKKYLWKDKTGLKSTQFQSKVFQNFTTDGSNHQNT